jgi:uncharacterized integral membrane protein
LLTAVVLVPVAAILLLFVLANREPVILSLDPFSPGAPGWSIQLPLFVVILLSVGIGVIVGGVADWFSQGRHRREARHGKNEVRRLEREAAELRRAQAPASATLPAPYRGEG